MSENFTHPHRRFLGSIFASSIILATGAIPIACVVAASGATVESFLILTGCGIGAIILMTIGARQLRTSDVRGVWGWVFSRDARPAPMAYTPRPRRTRPATTGTRRPPSVEEVRELKDGINTWVPSDRRGRRNN